MPSAGSPPPFPPTSYAMWRDGIEAELGPDAVTRRLRAKTEDGIPIEPLYAPGGPGDGEARNLSGRVVGLLPAREAGWRIRQRFPLTALRSALADALAGGVQSLELLVDEADRASGRPLAAALDGLELGDVEVSFEGLSPADLPALESLPGPVSFGIDPIGRVLQRGGAPGGLQPELARLGRMTRPGHARRLLRASGALFFDAGGTTGMTLGATLAVALAYLRALEEGGADPGWAAGTIEVRLPCGPRFFESIAMLRAARLVWARMLEIGSIAAAPPLRLVASSGRRTLTRHDPWVNALRNTAVAFAGAVGGADLIQLLPHDARTAEPGAAGLRLARTTGLVLREEASLRRVLDPAEGSWFLESFTAELAENAWDEVRRLEAAGGIVAAIDTGLLSRRIADAASARFDRVQTRRHPIIGVSEFPLAGELAEPETPGSSGRARDSAMPLQFRPDAEPFERLRDAAAHHAAGRGERARVFVARLGAPDEWRARSIQMENLLAAGGLEAWGPAALQTPSEAADAFRASGARSAILCSSDAVYERLGGDFAKALRAAGAEPILLAGKEGPDIVALLEQLQRAEGVR